MKETRRSVTPDGSPVPIYLQLPLEPEFTPVLQAIRTSSRILDLGCGVGRLANHLASLGNAVVGVDESAEMLAHLDDTVDDVCAKIEGLRLSDRFDVVVLASHFVNVADLSQRHALLETVACHLRPDGSAFIERYDPAWDPQPGEVREGTSGPVHIRTTVRERTGSEFAAQTVFRLGEDEWTQEFRARIVDDAELEEALAMVGLTAHRTLDERRSWVEAIRVGKSPLDSDERDAAISLGAMRAIGRADEWTLVEIPQGRHGVTVAAVSSVVPFGDAAAVRPRASGGAFHAQRRPELRA